MQHSHLLVGISHKSHFLFINILNVNREKIICPLVSLSSKEDQSQRGCIQGAGVAPERSGRIFGEGGDTRLLMLKRTFGKTTEMLIFFKVLLCGMQYHHPAFPKKSSVKSSFITKTIGVQFGLKEGPRKVLSGF